MARERINQGGPQDRKGRRWPVALPNATVTIALLGAIALGATSVGAIGLVASIAPTCQDEQGNVIDCPPAPPADGQGGSQPTPPTTDGTGSGTGSGTGTGDGAGAGTGSGTGAGATDGTGAGASTGSGDGAGTGTTEEPKPGHKPHPKPQTMGLALTNVHGGVKLDWTACTAAGFDAYKVVRSTDSIVRWPRGWHDRVVEAITDRGTTQWIDQHAPAGKKVWYRVFCVDKTDHGYRVLDSTHAKWIRTHRETPPPATSPVKFGLEAGLADGGVALHWDVCKADGFHWYKVVRSHGENPSYVPHTDGTELIGVIENPAMTSFTDGHVESGQSWFYRVQCVAFRNGEKVLLGQSDAVHVTIP